MQKTLAHFTTIALATSLTALAFGLFSTAAIAQGIQGLSAAEDGVNQFYAWLSGGFAVTVACIALGVFGFRAMFMQASWAPVVMVLVGGFAIWGGPQLIEWWRSAVGG